MSDIGACIWLDDQAEAAAEFYTSVFPSARITGTTRYTEVGREFHGKPPGSVMTVTFEVDGFSFTALNGGPHFTLNPAISFFVHCGTAEEVNQLWRELSHDGTVLMPLDTYPFSEHYGWLQDRFGVSWQLIVSPAASGSRIVPSFLFVGDECGNAETAMRFYASVFPEGTVGDIARYGPGYAPNPEDSVMYGEFRLLGRPFVAMDSAEDHEFSFNEGISLVVDTSTQQEIDRYWSGLSADPDAEQCGWLKDRFGVSWQIIPETEITHLLAHTDEATKKRTLEAMFRMKKIDLNELRGGHEQS